MHILYNYFIGYDNILYNNKAELLTIDNKGEIVLNMQTIKHIIVYFLVFIIIIGLTSTFTAKEFIGQAREIGLNGEEMLKMQVALNDANLSKEQDKLENNSQKEQDIIIENPNDDKLDDADREIFQKGDSNEKIKEYQEILFKLEYLKANPDGKFGPMTEEAIINFQAEENIEKTGKLDIETQKALEKSEELLDQDEEEEEEQEEEQENEEQEEQQEEQQESPDSTNQDTNIEHIVKANETLSQISEKYSVPLRNIYQANNLSEASTINIGQKIIIPKN